MFRISDVNASKQPKGTNAKIGDKEVMIPNSNFRSKLKYVGDTNIGTIDMIQLRDRLRDSQSSIAKKIYKSGVVHAAAFPPTLPCPELIMECASRLNIQSKSVMMDG
ncbi:hypothetical protein, partial [[Clostridium] innocuum]|uniref:hypothetical protein n=1 Tax=Clostridium innocuum TaxID=1522 RepID=UPI001E350C03